MKPPVLGLRRMDYRPNLSSFQARGLVAWYPLVHRGLTTIFNSIGGGVLHSLTPAAGSAKPDFQEGLRFQSASSQYAEVNTIPVSGPPVSISCWVKFASVGAGQQLVCLVASGNDANWHSLVLTGSSTAAVQSNGGSFGQSVHGTTLVAGKWYFLVGVWSSTTNRLVYVNGVPSTADTTSSTPAGLNRLAIGGLRRATPVEFLNGQLKDIRIYNRALSQAEVLAIYNNPDDIFEKQTVSYKQPAIVVPPGAGSGAGADLETLLNLIGI